VWNVSQESANRHHCVQGGAKLQLKASWEHSNRNTEPLCLPWWDRTERETGPERLQSKDGN